MQPKKIEDIDDLFDENDMQEKINVDAKQREVFDNEEKKLLEKIHIVRERLYDIRYDTTDKNKKLMEVQNQIGELRRLEALLRTTRKKALLSFEKSLDLGDMGLPYALSRSLESSGESSNDLHSQGINNSPQLMVNRKVLDDEDLAQLKLMRTESSEQMKGKSAQEKWKMLFSMYKNWKTNNDINEASLTLSENDEKEKKKLRQAIGILNNKKFLNPSDEKLLKKLQSKLRALSYK
eukprot:TRINITY_DN13800_c0_g1_i1.p1 TRINITY_DN13800_c0_g1~~TRINITY_DN13800_c0_g1_i1.p1  ORF type:complete len:236 (-),score=74.53 TRINITY_DN13800_c0_g1_i1:62-769(-)